MTVTDEAAEIPFPANAGHPLDEAPLPYWLSEPCPSWCALTSPHDDHEMYADRMHASAGHEIELSQEPPRKSDPSHLNAEMWQHYRDRDPHIVLTVNDHEEVLLELAEARKLARLLLAPAREWTSVTLTMMDPDAVLPDGGQGAGEPGPAHGVHFSAFPFTRSAVIAVSRVLDTVAVFTQIRQGDDQVPRYLALTPAEAGELAAALTALLEAAR
jgi:hypothetical protein